MEWHNMVRYPVTFEPDTNDTVLVSFPDFPEAHTFGDTEEDALVRAKDALATIIDEYIRRRRPLPAPSRTAGGHIVELPPMMSMKAELHDAMVALGITKADLARRLDVHPPQVDRLLDLRHQSRLDQLEAAAEAVGATFEVALSRAPRARRFAAPRKSRETRAARPKAAARRRTHKTHV